MPVRQLSEVVTLGGLPRARKGDDFDFPDEACNEKGELWNTSYYKRRSFGNSNSWKDR